LTVQEMLEELKEFDTPSITNVVATYPGNPLCLGLVQSLDAKLVHRPDRPLHVPGDGTGGWLCRDRRLRPARSHLQRQLSFMDVVDALDASPKPTIFVFEQRFPPELAGKVGLSGGNMTSAMKAWAAWEPSRTARRATSTRSARWVSSTCSAGSRPATARRRSTPINVPVSVAGMDVAPGEIIHMDENGAVKFPADKLEAVLDQRSQTARRGKRTHGRS
jgi:4-hydroxy-4-methyl-2-oxoglutarate aldolase